MAGLEPARGSLLRRPEPSGLETLRVYQFRHIRVGKPGGRTVRRFPSPFSRYLTQAATFRFSQARWTRRSATRR